MNDKILNNIKKHYKNTNMLLEMIITNYHEVSIYIRIDYYKKLKSYKLSWLDITDYHNDFDSIVSYEYVPIGFIDKLTNVISNIPQNEDNKELEEAFKVEINSNLKISNGSKFHLAFNRFIPTTNNLYFEIMAIIFNNLPKKTTCFGDEILASFLGNTAKYKYEDEINFDLFNDDIDKLFDNQIIERGREYYEQKRVFFLEKIADSYIAVVGGKGLYVTIIKYNEESKKMKMSCSCPCDFLCKHLYAVILAIRNQEFHKFYKLTHINDNTPMLERIMNFNFLLSIGIDDQGNNYLIIEDNLIKLLPIKNINGISEWEILEDDNNNTLTNKLKDILEK